MAYLGQGHMNTGHKLSAMLHGGLILWILVFDLFQGRDEPMIPDVTEVAIVSAQEFAALTQRETPAPAPAPAPERIAAPEPVAPPPQPVQAPEPIRPPEPIVPPEPERPQAAVVAPVVTPEASLTPVQRPAERVAPEAAPTPDPAVAIAPTDQAAITPDANATVEAPEAQDATQREAAATETVTEATRISETEPVRRTATAPEVSIRPERRPRRPDPVPQAEPAPQAEPVPTPAPEPVATPDLSNSIEGLLAEALAGADAPAELSQADVDMLRLNIEGCWNVGLLSQEALNTIVTIAFEMTPDARPVPQSIRLVGAEGGSFAAQQAAFDAGRQAIVQCGINGYGLPSDLYDQWQLVEITFNPARMINR